MRTLSILSSVAVSTLLLSDYAAGSSLRFERNGLAGGLSAKSKAKGSKKGQVYHFKRDMVRRHIIFDLVILMHVIPFPPAEGRAKAI